MLMFGVGMLQAKAAMDQESKKIAFVLEEESVLVGLRDALTTSNEFYDASAGLTMSPKEAIQAEVLDLNIHVAFSDKVYRIMIDHKDSVMGASEMRRFKQLVSELSDDLVTTNLVNMGVAEENVETLLNPISVVENDLATKQEQLGEILGSVLPFMIIVWMISSATAVSSDLVAGEKERGTLETLIISPVPLLAMITGKWVTVTLSSWFAGVLTLVSLWGSALAMSAYVGSVELSEMVLSMSIGTLLIGFVAMLPTAGLVSAIFLVSGSVASSFKEAQSYASGLMMLLFIPMFATLGGTVDLSLKTALLPIMNTSLIFTEMLKGTLDTVYIVPAVAINCVAIFAILTLAMSLYKSETVLKRQ
jgi:sodium transport system permease protein